MPQLLHVLTLTSDGTAVLMAHLSGRWLLPIIRMPSTARPGHASHAMRSICPSASLRGQWLGRVTATRDGIDWLLVAVASAHDRSSEHPSLGWVALPSLDPDRAVVAYQAWAVSRACKGGAPSVAGPFGSIERYDDVLRWIEAVAGAPIVRVWPFRLAAGELVLGVETAAGKYFFKGMALGRSREIEVTLALSRAIPSSFPQTIALRTTGDGAAWWLMAACPGLPLAERPTKDAIVRVAAKLARVQRRAAEELGGGENLGLLDVDIGAAYAWARERLLDASDGAPTVQLRERELAERRLREAIDCVAGLDAPRSWVPLDLDGGNVIVSAKAIHFIDLDGSCLAPAPLGLGSFVRKLRRLGSEAATVAIGEIVTAYALRCKPRVALDAALTALELVAALLDEHHAWQRLEARTRAGELEGALEAAPAAAAARLLRASRSSIHQGG